MKTELVPYKPEHALMIIRHTLRECDKNLSENDKKAWNLPEPAFSLFIDNQIVACGGLLIRNTDAEAWMLFSSVFYKHVKTTYKTIKYKLEELIHEYGLKRIFSSVKADLNGGRSFIEHLGFRQRTDYLLFSRIEEMDDG